MTVSVGVAEANRSSSRELLIDADEALYRAKVAGRNRVAACERKNAGGRDGEGSAPERGSAAAGKRDYDRIVD